MKTFFISDTHFNHYNIIKYCDRPFSSLYYMDQELIERWNNVVSKEDIVYHLGDFALGGKDVSRYYCQILNGRIRLVLGNHDTNKVRDYYEMGFDRVYDKPIIYNQFYILSHEPIFITENMPYANIYGHVHNNPEYKDVTSNTACVSVERIDYRPIEFDKLTKLMQSIR